MPEVPGLRVDAEDRSVRWRVPGRHLGLRGGVFLVAVIATIALERSADAPWWWVALGLVVIAVAAGAFVSALQVGWEVDSSGLRLHTGTRSPRRIPWGQVASLRMVERDERWHLEVGLVDGGAERFTRSGLDDPRRFRSTVEAAQHLDLVPPHVEVDT